MADIFAFQAAVIRAAWSFAEHPDHSIAKAELLAVVAAHKEAAVAHGAKDTRPTIKDFLREINLQKITGNTVVQRASAIVERELYGCWVGATLEEIAAYEWRDVRNAGPAIWRVWARALDKLGIEPTWMKVQGREY